MSDPIWVETLPLKIDLSGVGLDSRGDLDVTQAGGVVALIWTPWVQSWLVGASARHWCFYR